MKLDMARDWSSDVCSSDLVVPGESNYLLNPLHADFANLLIGNPRPFRSDPPLASRRKEAGEGP
jgi:hypothetical protein